MYYDSSVRKQIKKEQKSIVLKNFKNILLINFLYILPIGLSIVISILMLLSKNNFSLENAPLNDSFGYSSSFTEMILLMLISAPLLMGYMDYRIHLMRGGPAKLSLLFQPLTSLKLFGRSLRMYIILTIRQFLWTLIPRLVFIILLFMTNATSLLPGSPHASLANFIILIAILSVPIAIIIFLIDIHLSTFLAGFVRLYDNELIGCLDAQREGAQAFRGHYVDLLLFFLSFAPWYILEVLISIILLAIGVAIPPLLLVFIVAIFIFSSFIDTYQTMSFLRLFDHLASAPNQPSEHTPLDTASQIPYWQTPDQTDDQNHPDDSAQ